MKIALWIVQGLLAAAFLMIGGMKMFQSAADILKNMPDANIMMVRFIGVAEVAGALGLLLPQLTRIQPKLTPIAAWGLFIIMVLAFALHLAKGEYSHSGGPVVFGAMAAFVAVKRGQEFF